MVIPAVMPSYTRADVAFERGDGAYLYATDGRRFLDFASGIAVTALGHNHPRLVKTLTEQAGKLWHCSNLFEIPDQTRLAERLVANSFADTVFFCNSGAEASEGSMKLIRKYHDATGNPDRYRIISFEGSFHGRTLAGISVGANKAHQAGFGPLVEAFDHVPFGNMNAVRDAITPETAAIMVEPVQGEGGIHVPDPAFLRALRQACDEYGLLLCFDEVQTGMGRTGKLFAYEWSGIAPDVMGLAKGLGGGFPVGAILATEAAAQGINAGTHGSTFGGNPLAMAVANAVLDVMLEDGFLDNVVKQGAALTAGVRDIIAASPGVADEVRGLSLLIGIHCVKPAGELVTALRNAGLLTVPAADNVCRLLPPLTIGAAEVDEALAAIEKVFREMAG